jgi:hypothetical protein
MVFTRSQVAAQVQGQGQSRAVAEPSVKKVKKEKKEKSQLQSVKRLLGG